MPRWSDDQVTTRMVALKYISGKLKTQRRLELSHDAMTGTNGTGAQTETQLFVVLLQQQVAALVSNLFHLLMNVLVTACMPLGHLAAANENFVPAFKW